MVAMLDKEVVAACHADAVVCAVQEALGLERHLLIFFSASQAEGDLASCTAQTTASAWQATTSSLSKIATIYRAYL